MCFRLPRRGRCQTLPVAPRAGTSSACSPSVRAWLVLALGIGGLALGAAGARAGTIPRPAARFRIPASALQLVVVSSPSRDPADRLARLQSFRRASSSAPWRRVLGVWTAEIGSGGLKDVRREGDHSTPTGVFAFGSTMYGNEPNPGGLHERYRRLGCGDWWDEDPYSSAYNQFVHAGCDSTPPFAGWSEALWTERRAYPYLAVIDFNEHPTISGAGAPGSGIFLHAWMGEPTEGCVALPVPNLLRELRWLSPAAHPVIEIGTVAEVGRAPRD
jgi:L,D-peptidoglycan transpeptidase YkuD (ErfK/YbiS/YcfS/YnhG family)